MSSLRLRLVALFLGASWVYLAAAQTTRIAGRHLEFSALSISDGLSQSSVYDIVQDRHGFLWFATEDGLNRYDGVGFRVYKHNPKDPSSISESHILSLYVDPEGILWVGTFGGGLNRYDESRDAFVRYLHDDLVPNSISGNHVIDMVCDVDGDLWVATLDSGVSCWSRQRDEFISFAANPDTPGNLNANLTYSIASDPHHGIWVGTIAGINYLDKDAVRRSKSGEPAFANIDIAGSPALFTDSSIHALLIDSQGLLWVGTTQGLLRSKAPISEGIPDSFHVFQPDDAENHGLSNGSIRTVFEDSAGHIYVGSDGGGLYLYDRDEDHFFQYDHRAVDPESISGNRVWSVLEDRSGLIWVGTFVAGVNRLNLRRLQFNHLYQDTRQQKPLPDNFIKAIFQDSRQRQWLGTSSGLVQISPDYPDSLAIFGEGPVLAVERHHPGDPHSLAHDYVRWIAEDPFGFLWIATWGGGLSRREPDQPRYQNYRPDPNDPHAISHSLVRTVMVDRNGTVWAGTSAGINRYRNESDDFEHYHFEPLDSPRQDRNRISFILESQSGYFWLGTDGGLLRFDPRNGVFVSYNNDRRQEHGLSSNLVRPIYEDPDGILWVGTKGGGLNRFNPETNEFVHFTEADGLPNNVIYTIIPDERGMLWLATNRGLAEFDPDTGQCKLFTERDGLQSDEFNWGASFKRRDGILMFGGINGVNAFDPTSLKRNEHRPAIALRDFRIGFNNEELDRPIWTMNAVTLPHHQNAFTVEFAALDFTDPSRNRFRFKLEGLDDEWNDIGNQNRITYTNLDAGVFNLRVQGANSDGVWNRDGSQLRIAVVPPWWKTQLAKSFFIILMACVLLLGLLVFIRRRDQLQQRLLNEKERELEQERKVAERLEQLDRLKDEFLTNTSHELRTPLNGIIGLADALLRGSAGELNPSLRSDLFLVLSSARRLTNLVNDILDYAQLRQDTIALNPRPLDLHGMTNLVLSLLRPLVGKKDIKLINDISPNLRPVWADENRMHQILHNLIGNAIKFTDEGEVRLSANAEGDTVRISVQDTGVGIPAELKGQIFDSFEKGDEALGRHYEGTGLGLAISRKLVKLHRGELQVESTSNQGSTFTFTLPLSKEPLSLEGEQPLPELEQLSDDHSEPLDHTHAHILIVDDEPINLRVLTSQLRIHGFRTTEAQSAEEALRLVESEQHFDLIILDIMLPRSTGLFVCREIRKKHNMEDLPIILLTAKTLAKDMAAGFEAGANDYVMKPITADELIPRLKTHLKAAELKGHLAEAREAASHFESEREKAMVATSVLHNIGNVLNSLRISSQQIQSVLSKSKAHYLDRVVNMIKSHQDNLAHYLTQDSKGKLLPDFIQQASSIITEEHAYIDREVVDLSKKLELMRSIIETQQRLAKAELDGIQEHYASDLIREAMQIQEQFLARRSVEVTAHLDDNLKIRAQELHAINVLINLIKNAVESMEANRDRPKQLVIESGINRHGESFISIQDNGIGIEPKQHERLFEHGYTTKAHGHGFGLHYGINAMRNMGGDLKVQSDGRDSGAKFTMVFHTSPKAVSSKRT